MRRFFWKASSLAPASIGWNSPYPAATRRSGGTPRATRYLTTDDARAVDSSQFDGNAALAIGRVSVWPSTCNAQSISLGNLLLEFDDRCRELIHRARALGRQGRRPEGNSTSDSKTKRSPTTRMSLRSFRSSRRRPKKSDR